MGEMFSDILAEIRAYGQGLGIIDEVPSKLVTDAIKNTNLKIVHRLVSADDRDAMANALALTEDQPHIIARLKVGQAIVSGIKDDMASWIQFLTPPARSQNQAGLMFQAREQKEGLNGKTILPTSITKMISYYYLVSYCPPTYIEELKEAGQKMLAGWQNPMAAAWRNVCLRRA